MIMYFDVTSVIKLQMSVHILQKKCLQQFNKQQNALNRQYKSCNNVLTADMK